MNCKLCKQQVEAYLKGRLPESIRNQVKEHLESCSECAEVYQMETIAGKVINSEKAIPSNPFLSTRVMVGIEALEPDYASKENIPVYKRILKPALITMTLAAALFTGVLIGNVYKPSPQMDTIPVELGYINDASLESVNLLTEN